MLGLRLVLLLGVLHQSQLNGIVAIGGRRFPLRHHARARFDQCHRDYLPIRREHLRHADLFAENSWTHVSFPVLKPTHCRLILL